jgi:hypothetical protein
MFGCMSILRSIQHRLVSIATLLVDRKTRAPYDRSSLGPLPSRNDLRSAGRGEADKPPAHADERTIRQIGEAQLGGLSTEESRAAYERGENVGGLHHRGKGPASAGEDDN